MLPQTVVCYNVFVKLADLIKQAVSVRKLFSKFEKKTYGKEWGNKEIMEGFIVDTGELMRLVMAKEGLRKEGRVDEKLKHELADCLWCILILAQKYNINLEEAFTQTMIGLKKKLRDK